MRPARRCVRPRRVAISVDLPTPLRPRRARLPPSGSVKATSSITTASPYPAVSPSTSRRLAMDGLAQVDLLHAGVSRHLLGRALGEHLPADEDGDAFGEA